MSCVSLLRAILVLSVVMAAASSMNAQVEKGPAKKQADKKAAKAKGATKAKDVVVDADTAALLDRMEERRYYAGKEGVKKASCAGEVSMEVPGQPPQKLEFRYEWDGTGEQPSGKTTFSDPALGAQVKQAMPNLNEFFHDESPWREEFAGCKLVASREGAKTRVKVSEGKSKNGFTEIVLNADELPEEVTGMPPGAPASLTMKMAFAKLGEKFGASKVDVAMGGTPVQDIAVEYALVKKYHVPSKVTTTMSVPGAKVVLSTSLKDYQIEEGATGAPREDAPKKPGAKAEKQAKAKTGASGK